MEGIKDLTAWLEADDANGRVMRVRRLHDLLGILPVPSEELRFFGGEESVICFGEVRRCYLDGSNMAVVLLCLGPGICRAGTCGGALCSGLGRSQKRSTGSGVGKSIRRRIAVRPRVAHIPPDRRTEELARPLSRTGKPDISHNPNHRGRRLGTRGPRKGRAARTPDAGEICQALLRYAGGTRTTQRIGPPMCPFRRSIDGGDDVATKPVRTIRHSRLITLRISLSIFCLTIS